jgi:hypothetical protein
MPEKICNIYISKIILNLVKKNNVFHTMYKSYVHFDSDISSTDSFTAELDLEHFIRRNGVDTCFVKLLLLRFYQPKVFQFLYQPKRRSSALQWHADPRRVEEVLCGAGRRV